MLDLLIRGGLVVDGTGAPPVRADIAVQSGRIAAVGTVDGPARETVDAVGLVVTPGFVDVHTHYDGQATWDPYLAPSSWHGVTTVVMGNCGVGFAPVREADRAWLIRLMEGVEDIPGSVLSEGIQWQWESFPEYQRALAARSFAVDVATQIPHGPLRTYVMGERGADHRAQPTEPELRQMGELVQEALRCGAIGFSTSRTMAHRSSDGAFTPSLSATPAELLAIAGAMRQAGAGLIEIVSDFNPLEPEFDLIRQIAAASGRPVSVAVTQTREDPAAWRRLFELIEAARAGGLDIHAQIAARPVSILFGLSNRANFLLASETYRRMLGLPLAEQVARLQSPAVKQAVLGDLRLDRLPTPIFSDWANSYRFAADLPYLPDVEQSVARVAARTGAAPESVAYDWLVEGDGSQFLFQPMRNYSDGDDRVLRAMLGSPHAIVGLGDAGAHCGVLCDASMPTFMLTRWRDAGYGLAGLVQKLTQHTAAAWGLKDRGEIAAGKRADLNLIDLERLRLQMPAYERDLPANGGRLVQRARGYVATFVQGVATMRDGQPTGALPGRLING